MVDDTSGASPKNEPAHTEVKEDAQTRAARRELMQSSISDPPVSIGDSAAASTDGKTTRPETPLDNAPDTQEDDLKAQVSSPKKKRAHDQLGGDRDLEDNDANSIASIDSTKDRALRLEPEKKRARDEDSQADAANTSVEQTTEAEKSPARTVPQTSSSAFAASGFGKLATVSSPFANLSGTQPSAFGAFTGSSSLSTFGSSAAAPASKPAAIPTPKFTFGGANSASPFAGLSSLNGFGSGASGSGFGSVFSTGRAPQASALSAGKPIPSRKPAKPFGAPESDGDDEDDDSDGDENAEQAEGESTLSPERDLDDRKKLKLQRVEVDDGETGEVTIISVRAKMFHHDKEAGWKERGGGMLKINAPQSCVEFDDSGVPIPGSFDASGLDTHDKDDDAPGGRKVVRLIMRQDQTHRVILNTALLPLMNFQEKASLKSVGILFTAFEGEEAKPVSVTMKMSAANAKSFINEIVAIQGELQGN